MAKVSRPARGFKCRGK